MTTAQAGNARLRTLLIVALGLVALPFAMRAIGLTLDSAIVIVVLCMATMGLNLLVGYTGLVSFGHSAWFGIGGYAAAISQLHWFKGQFVAPLVFSAAFTAALALVVGFLILRRRGVYFSLLTLALCALAFAIAFRWTSLTGGEGGLGGIERGTLGPVDLDSDVAYYTVVALIGLAVAIRPAPRGALAVRTRARRDPRERAAGDVPGLRDRPVQARGLRAVDDRSPGSPAHSWCSITVSPQPSRPRSRSPASSSRWW